MSNDRRRRTEFMIASVLLVAGLTISGFSLMAIVQTDVRLAQGTPPLQPSSPSMTEPAPAEAKPGGTRPTTPAPAPARPDPQAQQEGARAALPPAPAEKMAPPIQSK